MGAPGGGRVAWSGRRKDAKEITHLLKIQTRSLPPSQVSKLGILKEKVNFLLPVA